MNNTEIDKTKIFLVNENDENKWINVKFLIDFNHLLERYVLPKSESLSEELSKSIITICNKHGYVWPEEYNCTN